jgi:uncharacterized integral membrane protein
VYGWAGLYEINVKNREFNFVFDKSLQIIGLWFIAIIVGIIIGATVMGKGTIEIEYETSDRKTVNYSENVQTQVTLNYPNATVTLPATINETSYKYTTTCTIELTQNYRLMVILGSSADVTLEIPCDQITDELYQRHIQPIITNWER